MCAKVVILPDSANSFPFFLMSVKVEITWRWARLKSKVIEIGSEIPVAPYSFILEDSQ